ncbi:type II toxin-antitoxin system RelE/ParE family toxin [Sphingomonas sp. LB2R24]|uniref:type II toxin-antitoxin system RelE/ParE family toxin n=1 Tax=Sphingomonas sorbitolis TaxID=3096165 RepID=UPI002FC6C776
MQYEIATTDDFDDWFDGLRDSLAVTAIRRNIVKLSGGLFGNVEAVGSGVSELKVDVGAGYRIYFVTRGRTIIVLLTGGDKSSQRRDIARAKEMAGDLE